MKKTRTFGIFLAVFILLILYLYMNFISFNITLQFFLFDIDESWVLKFIDILSRNYENGTISCRFVYPCITLAFN